MKYKNYIFDLYGTLIDIDSDERKLSLWRKLSDLYACYGAIYTPKELRKAFFRMDKEERLKVKNELGTDRPEIKLEKVFVRLLTEAPKLNVKKSEDTARSIRIPDDMSVWSEFMANAFRTLSRSYIRNYDKTLYTLDTLRKNGCSTFLLSNAQAIFTRPEISLLELEERFDRMYISSDYGRMKPDPVFLETLISDNSLSREDTVMVGDTVENDVLIAYSCNIDAILVNTSELSKKQIKKQAKELGIERSFKTVSSIDGILF